MRTLIFAPIILAYMSMMSICSFADDHESAEQKLITLVDAIAAFSADLEQVTQEADGYILDTQTGNMVFARPNLLRWETLEPFSQTLVADGSHIYLHDPDLNQVTVRSWSSDPAVNPVAVFMASEQLKARFNVSEESDIFYLEPISVDASFQQMRLAFRQGLPAMLAIDDNLGQTTQIEFTNAQVLQSPEESLFKFKIPEGAEIFNDG